MPNFTNDPVVSKTTTTSAISVVGESAKNEGVRGISHSDHGAVVGINHFSPASPPGAGGNGGWFESAQGEGVRGWAKTPHHGGVVGVNTGGGFGVFGQSDANTAVVGESTAGNGGWFESKASEGVRGVSHNPNHGGVVGICDTANGIGVFGFCDDGKGALVGTGVFGKSSGGEGVHGETNANTFVAAVSGIALNQDGIAPGVLGQSIGGGPGVVGKSFRDAGVIGFRGDPALQETTVANDGGKAGVFGASDAGAGVLGYSRDPNSPAVFAFGGFRSLALGKPLAGWFQGNVQVDGDIFLPGADCAEQFDVADAEQVEAGAVVVIDQEGALRQSQEAYDRKVAGVVSGAGDFRPGIVLDKRQSQENRLPVALVGKVYCKVDAQYGPIEVGDLLTTSATPGHAMKVLDPLKGFGAVIGKALRPWRSGSGLIPILVCLQ